MELYIIRHAQSTNNVLKDERDRVVDPPLTQLGERQAEALAEHLARGTQPLSGTVPEGVPANGGLRGYGLTRLYCSPMIRSMQTAEAIARAVGLTPEVWIEIHEQGGMFLEEGEGEARKAYGKPGMTRAEILARFPAYVLPQGITDTGWWTAGYEEWAGCHARAAAAAAQLREWAHGPGTAGERVAIVSHGGFADTLLKALLHGNPAAASNGNGPNIWYQHLNTAIDHLDFRDDGRLRVAYLNRVAHLPPEMISL